MDIQTFIPGASVLILVVAAVLTAPLSFFLLWLYRRAVLRGMNVATGVTDPALPSVAQAPPGHSLRITGLTPRVPAGHWGGHSQLDREVTLSLRRVALAYMAGGLTFAVLFAAAQSVEAGGLFPPIRFLFFIVCFAWPIVLTLNQLAAVGWRDRLDLTAAYFIALVIVGGLAVSRQRDPNPLSLLMFWLLANGPGTLLLIAFLTRRVRAVGPLVLVFMIAGVAGAVVLPEVLSSEQVVSAFFAVGLGGSDAFNCLLLAGFVVFGVAGWGLLRLIGRRYQQKRMSDQSLTLDAIWLLFAMTYAVDLALDSWMWILVGPVAFVLYKLVLKGVLGRFMRPAADKTNRPTLLLLRVFSLGPRSLRLFDALAKYWLRAGPMVLIAGPDLVTGIVEPQEFLEFLGGRVSRRFVQGRDDLEQRLSQLDTRPDPDGRYRVNEFFCRANTWQMTMRELAARSDTVCMDLRSFSPSNQGCQYELGQLLDGVPLTRVLLMVDDTTDRPFLEDTLQSLWQKVPADSPNHSLQAPEVRLFEAHSGTGAEVRALLSLLFGQQRLTAVADAASHVD